MKLYHNVTDRQTDTMIPEAFIALRLNEPTCGKNVH